jgi:hypothetical protein
VRPGHSRTPHPSTFPTSRRDALVRFPNFLHHATTHTMAVSILLGPNHFIFACLLASPGHCASYSESQTSTVPHSTLQRKRVTTLSRSLASCWLVISKQDTSSVSNATNCSCDIARAPDTGTTDAEWGCLGKIFETLHDIAQIHRTSMHASSSRPVLI